MSKHVDIETAVDPIMFSDFISGEVALQDLEIAKQLNQTQRQLR